MEEKRPLELVKFVEKLREGRDTSDLQRQVLGFWVQDFDAVLDYVDVGIGHDFDQVVAHVFHLYFEPRAQTCIPFLLHGGLDHLVYVFGVHSETQAERRLRIEGLLLKLGYRNAEREEHSLDGLARKEPLDVGADNFDLDLTEARRDWHVKHLVDREVKHFLLRTPLQFQLAFHSHEPL